MSAIVCGKRSFFEDLQSPSPTSPSTPVSKKLRWSSTFTRRFSPPPPEAASIDHLRLLFPDVDSQFLDKVLEECGDDLNVAIKRLHELHLSHAQGKSVTTSEADGEMDGGGIDNAAFVLNNLPADGTEWVELFVREMKSAINTDDARARATRLLKSLEKSISVSASAEEVQNFQKENVMLKEQLEMILRDNDILKRVVVIQHERQKEHNDRIQEVQQLKQLIAQYQEQLRTLEVNNYSLKMHLQQAQQCNSIPGHFHPDVF